MSRYEHRRINASDWREYREIRLRALADAPEAFSTKLADVANEPDAFWIGRLTGLGPASDFPVFAIAEGAAVGLAWGKRDENYPALAHLHHMWVDPSHRGHGVGELLVEAVFGWGSAHGAKAVHLTVAERNAAATRLYLRLGFERIGPPALMRGSTVVHEQEMRRGLAPATS